MSMTDGKSLTRNSFSIFHTQKRFNQSFLWSGCERYIITLLYKNGTWRWFLSFFCVICAIFHILTFLKRVIFISIFLLFQCNKWGSILLYKFYSFEKGSNIYGFFNEHTGKLCKKRLFLNQEHF